jgi:hypothetical protein
MRARTFLERARMARSSSGAADRRIFCRKTLAGGLEKTKYLPTSSFGKAACTLLAIDVLHRVPKRPVNIAPHGRPWPSLG